MINRDIKMVGLEIFFFWLSEKKSLSWLTSSKVHYLPTQRILIHVLHRTSQDSGCPTEFPKMCDLKHTKRQCRVQYGTKVFES